MEKASGYKICTQRESGFIWGGVDQRGGLSVHVTVALLAWFYHCVMSTLHVLKSSNGKGIRVDALWGCSSRWKQFAVTESWRHSRSLKPPSSVQRLLEVAWVQKNVSQCPPTSSRLNVILCSLPRCDRERLLTWDWWIGLLVRNASDFVSVCVLILFVIPAFPVFSCLSMMFSMNLVSVFGIHFWSTSCLKLSLLLFLGVCNCRHLVLMAFTCILLPRVCRCVTRPLFVRLFGCVPFCASLLVYSSCISQNKSLLSFHSFCSHYMHLVPH